jgi:hypothetical protein
MTQQHKLKLIQKTFIFIGLFVLPFSSVSTWAQTCCSGGVPLSGNLGMPVADKHTWQFALSYDVNVMKTLKVGTEKLDERNRQRITHSVMLQAGYTLSDRFSADLFVPFIRQERKILNSGSLENDFRSTTGLGDMVFLLKYNLINKGPVVWTLGAGPKFPTGASDITNNGILLGADLQPGSGAWDGVLWSSLVHQIQSRKSMNLSLIANYRITGTNENFRLNQSYQFGRDFQAIGGIADRILIGKVLVDPSLLFRYRKVQQDKAGGSEIPNTGGEWVFINPAVAFNIGDQLSINFGFELPLYANITGTQLTPTYRVTTGLYYVLNRNSVNILDLQRQ